MTFLLIFYGWALLNQASMLPDPPATLPKPTVDLLRKYAEAGEQARKWHVYRAETDLNQGKAMPAKTPKQKADKAEYVDELQAELTAIKSGAKLIRPYIDIENPKAGQIGQLAFCHVIEKWAIPEKTSRNKNKKPSPAQLKEVERWNAELVGTMLPDGDKKTVAEVAQITEECVFVRVAGLEHRIALRGLDKSNLVDGSKIDLNQVWICAGPKTFESVNGGTTTLFTFDIFPHVNEVELWQALRIAALKQPEKK